MQKIRKNFMQGMLALAAMLSLSACDDGPRVAEAGLVVSLRWTDAEEAGTPVEDLRLWIYREDGSLAEERRYGSEADMAAERHALPAGTYTLVAAANLVEPFEATADGEAGTSPADALEFKLPQPNASPRHAHYAATTVSLHGNGPQRATLELRRVMAELSVTVEGVPQGAVLAVEVANAAEGLMPAVPNGEGGFGTTTRRIAAVTMPQATETNGTAATGFMRLMPTADGQAASRLHFTLTLPGGTVQLFDADAPVMKPAGKYIVSLEYASMKPYMRLCPVSINDWTEGWTLYGEIADPDTAP